MPASLFSDVRLVAGTLPDYTSFATGIEAVVQRVRFRLLTHEGEWFADPRKGLPWKEWVQTKPVPTGIIHAFVKKTIAAVPGVARILRSVASFDGPTRTLSIQVEAEIERSTVELEYLLSGIEYGNVSPYVTYRVLRAAV